MNTITRTSSVQWAALAAAVSLTAATPVLAQGDASKFPSRPIRMIVPFPPGGSNDIVGRFMAQRMSERMGQQTIVDNRPGADGIIGSDIAARSTPDGHTILIISTSYAMNTAVHKLPFDPVKALAPIAQIGTGANLIASGPGFAANSVKDLIDLAKAKPGQIRYASSGIGGFNHFGGELFNTMAGVKLAHIPYKGGGPAMVDVMSGQVEVVFGTLTQALPHVRSGRLKALGVGSRERSPLLPQVPTIHESGVTGYDGSIWWGLLAPSGVPKPIIAKLNDEINTILREPATQKSLATQAADPVVGPPDALGKLIVSDIAKWHRVAKTANIRAE